MSRDLTNLFIDETFQYLTQISGSNRDILEDGLGNRITELDITASNSISSSHSVTADSSSFSNVSISASYSTTAETALTASYAITASYALNSIPQVSASYAVSSSQAENANTATSASYALTASYALNAGGGGFPYTGSAIISGSLTVETLNYPGFIVVNPNNPLNSIQIAPEDGNSYTKNVFNMGAEKNFFQSPGELYFNTNWDAGSSGSINFISPSNINMDADSDINVTAGNGIFGNVTVEGNNINLSPVSRTQVNGTLYNNIFDTGSQTFQIDAAGIGGLLMGVGGYVGGLGEWNTTAQMTFYGADQAFFSAENDFYIKNIYNDTGSITVWSENALTLRGDTSVEIYGGDPFTGTNPQEQINITGKAFATSIASNINGFSITIDKDTTVRQNIRAFVETPMQVAAGKTITVEAGATLKVINEL